jgi:hypothetical protein
VAAYEPLKMNLVVVHRQGEAPDIARLQQSLNGIYGQAAVSWNVRAELFNYAFPAEIETGNTLLSSYSKEMNAIIKAFRKGRRIDGKTYYVFTVPSISGDAGGYMPLNRQFGFVENSGNPEHAMAHELGHGAFNLWHTFSEKDFIAAQGATDNLMDYSGGTRLYRHQWDLVHNPEAVLMPGLVDEEEVMMIGGLSRETMLNYLKMLRNGYLDFESRNIDDLYVLLRGKDNGETAETANTPIQLPGSSISLSYLAVKYVGADNGFYIKSYRNKVPATNCYECFSEGYSQYTFYGDVSGTYIKVIVKESEQKKLERYLFPAPEGSLQALLEEDRTLTVDEIADIRENYIKSLPEDQQAEAYLELQMKVPYHNQRDNNQEQYVADRMCNLTSEAMCFEYLGISNPNPDMQFEDYLEQIRIENGYGDRTTQGARAKLAKHLGVCYDKENFNDKFSQKRTDLESYILPKLKSGYSVMLSVWPDCKGHLVRVLNIDSEGITVDDPYGRVTDFVTRENCSGSGYDLNSETAEDNKGDNNLWLWSDLANITVKYVEIYYNCDK